MAVPVKRQPTQDDFEAFVDLPENHERTFELIGGEIVEVPSNPLVSKIAMLIGAALLVYLSEHDIGHITGADGGYIVNGERYVPDVAFISYARQPQLPARGYNPNPPELAVEVISDPSSGAEQYNLRLKVSHYLAAGTLVWVINPASRTAEVYESGKPAQIIREDDTLRAGDILPGFELPLRQVFRTRAPQHE